MGMCTGFICMLFSLNDSVQLSNVQMASCFRFHNLDTQIYTCIDICSKIGAKTTKNKKQRGI